VSIDILKTGVIDKDQNILLLSGYAQASLPVHFQAKAKCLVCGKHPIKYDWDFGDGKTGVGETVKHTYDENGAGTRNVVVTATCNKCNASATYKLTVHAIAGVEVIIIGGEEATTDTNRISLNDSNECRAIAQPVGSLPDGASKLIDWWIFVGSYQIKVPNNDNPHLDLPIGDWPQNNFSWGPGEQGSSMLWATIDGGEVPNQEDELITGRNSFLFDARKADRFFEKEGHQNPDGRLRTPNWFYY